MRLQFRQLALDDLDNIWDYSYSKWGPEQTERYVGAVRQKLNFERLVTNQQEC